MLGWPRNRCVCLLPSSFYEIPPKGIKITCLFLKVNHQSSSVGADSHGDVQPKDAPSVWTHAGGFYFHAVSVQEGELISFQETNGRNSLKRLRKDPRGWNWFVNWTKLNFLCWSGHNTPPFRWWWFSKRYVTVLCLCVIMCSLHV